MMSFQLQKGSRLYSSVATSQLALLRKNTGFPLSKCREALSKNSEELEEAEKWLYKHAKAEGWVKVEKLKNRTARQGLVGLLIRDNKAAMLEVNCETDFVAKNDKFQALVSSATKALFHHQLPKVTTTDSPALSVSFLTSDEIGQLKSEQGPRTLADTTAEFVGLLSENLVLQRACVMCVSQGILCGHVYGSQSPDPHELKMGKYAALLHLQPSDGGFSGDSQTLGKNISQHIIGMNPEVVEEDGVVDPAKVLTKQGFVLDDSVSVGDMLASHAARVTKFVRYAVGETA